MKTRHIIAGVVGAGLLLAQTASASIIVGYDPAAATSNFGTPGIKNHNVAYEITTSADMTYAYFGFKARPDLGGALNGLDFVNFYLSTSYPGGSTVGFEPGNNRAFKPGVSGYYDNISGAGVVVAHAAAGDWSVAVPWSFLQNDPMEIGFNKVTAANNKVTLNLSQAFGYSVAGGSANYGSARLGLVEMAPMAPVPEPSTYLAGALLLLPFGVSAMRKFRKS